MKKIVCLALLVSSFCFAQKYTIVQINAEWNDKNTLQLPKVIEGANVVFGYLENQNEVIMSRPQVISLCRSLTILEVLPPTAIILV